MGDLEPDLETQASALRGEIATLRAGLESLDMRRKSLAVLRKRLNLTGWSTLHNMYLYRACRGLPFPPPSFSLSPPPSASPSRRTSTSGSAGASSTPDNEAAGVEDRASVAGTDGTKSGESGKDKEKEKDKARSGEKRKKDSACLEGGKDKDGKEGGVAGVKLREEEWLGGGKERERGRKKE